MKLRQDLVKQIAMPFKAGWWKKASVQPIMKNIKVANSNSENLFDSLIHWNIVLI